MNPRARNVLLGLVLLACLPPLVSGWRENGKPAQAGFVMPAPARQTGAAPEFKAELITPDPVTPAAHVASVCEGPDGALNAAWYGGSREGAGDVDIFLSRLDPGADKTWSKPQVLVSRDSAARELRRPVKKVGNAVLFADAAGRLRLIYVTTSLGGWSTSSLNLKTSRDAGQTWLPSQRLTLSPFFNFSELVKNNPAILSDGGWAVPIYHEFLAEFPEILWMRESADGELSWSKTRIFGGATALQPALVPQSREQAVVLCRDSSATRRIQLSRSADLGKDWSAPRSLTLPNSDSGLDALRLFDGRILLAFNDSQTGRDNLTLALSDDAGLSWSRRAVLESEPGAEFSYPYLIQAGDGRVHLVYTWKRKAIKHAAFNPAWLDSQAKTGPGGAK
jgi:predicted neuraminidase